MSFLLVINCIFTSSVFQFLHNSVSLISGCILIFIHFIFFLTEDTYKNSYHCNSNIVGLWVIRFFFSHVFSIFARVEGSCILGWSVLFYTQFWLTHLGLVPGSPHPPAPVLEVLLRHFQVWFGGPRGLQLQSQWFQARLRCRRNAPVGPPPRRLPHLFRSKNSCMLKFAESVCWQCGNMSRAGI